MSRATSGVQAHARHKKVLSRAKGYRGRNKNAFRIAKEKVEKGLQYAYRDRRAKKRNFRALWIQRYYQSLRLLDNVKRLSPGLFTKSGLMVGLGEEKGEIIQVMDDLRVADVDFLTIGQYLQPTLKHHPVVKYVTPSEFEDYAAVARTKKFLVVASSPLTRSSYHADRDFSLLRQARSDRLS